MKTLILKFRKNLDMASDHITTRFYPHHHCKHHLFPSFSFDLTTPPTYFLNPLQVAQEFRLGPDSLHLAVVLLDTALASLPTVRCEDFQVSSLVVVRYLVLFVRYSLWDVSGIKPQRYVTH